MWGDDTGGGVVMAMKLMSARHGVPGVVTSDNGSRFKDFTERRELKCASNGLMFNKKKKRSPQAIKMKNFDCGNDKLFIALRGITIHHSCQWDVF